MAKSSCVVNMRSAVRQRPLCRAGTSLIGTDLARPFERVAPKGRPGRIVMKKHVAITLGATMASMLCVSAANAQTVVTTGPAHETAVTGGPNSALLGSGLFTFGVPYVAPAIPAPPSNNHPHHTPSLPFS